MAPSSVFLPTLPGRYYTEPGIFEAEQREIFEKQWVYVCRAQDVPAQGRDFAAPQWCQPNMRSRAYANGGVLVPTEQEVIGRWYYRWYRESMGLESLALGDSR